MGLIPQEFVPAPVVADLYSLAAEVSDPSGLHMEFGVANGRSLRALRKVFDPSIKLYGFDSFDGLSTRWRDMPPGTFRTSYRVELPNTELVVGRFEQTLPRFVPKHLGPVSFMHIDCDLYSSTKTVLTAFKQQIVPGTVILFDELFGYEGYEADEYLAWREFNARFTVLARWNAFRALIRIDG